MKIKSLKSKLSLILALALGVSVVATGCGSNKKSEETNKETTESIQNQEKDKSLKFGVAPGPYGDMIEQAIKPELEKKGYKVELVQFSDYVQPNKALDKKETDANMFQHTVYLEKFSEDHGLKLSPVIVIPTAAAGIYSNKVKSLDEIKDGSQITIPSDPTNLARALKVLKQAGLVEISQDVDPGKASEKDITKNPKNLKIVPADAAQLPRTLDSAELSIINGNYAISSGLDLSEALFMEELEEDYKNIIAVRTEDLDKDFVKDIKEAVESEGFKKVIEDDKYMFKYFQKPGWFK